MKRFIPLVALTLLLAASSASAAVPSTISYQGVLTDGGGNLVPNGAYNLTFRIYDVQVLGAPLWTETQVGVNVTLGGFAVHLGAVNPLTSLAFDKPYWLGIAVGANPEMTPRVTMAASPYGLSLRLPFDGSSTSSSPTLGIHNDGGGTAVIADPSLQAGTAARDGSISAYAAGQVGFDVGPYGPLGSYTHWLNPSFGYLGGFEPDGDGAGGGYFWIGGGNFSGGLTVDGNGGGSNGASVYITGPSSSTYFDTNSPGDAAVSLPADAVGSAEILDEPGIAQGRGASSVFFTDAAFTDVISTTITTPGPGYIVLEGSGQVNLSGVTTSNTVTVQITDSTPGIHDFGHYGYLGQNAYAGTGSNFYLVDQQRVYYQASAGTFTYYFQFRRNQPTGSSYIFQPTLRATYYPTSYGTVTSIAAGAEAGQFSSARPVVTDDAAAQPSAAGAVQVDLRELELRVERERADLERAQRQLVEARLAEQAKLRAPARKGGN